MSKREPYTLIYAPVIRDHLRAIDTKHHTLIRQKIEEQLKFDPDVETRNRKPLRQPAAFGAEWETRFGPKNRFRVLYEIEKTERKVMILAIGEKDGNRLFVSGEEIEL